MKTKCKQCKEAKLYGEWQNTGTHQDVRAWEEYLAKGQSPPSSRGRNLGSRDNLLS